MSQWAVKERDAESEQFPQRCKFPAGFLNLVYDSLRVQEANSKFPSVYLCTLHKILRKQLPVFSL